VPGVLALGCVYGAAPLSVGWIDNDEERDDVKYIHVVAMPWAGRAGRVARQVVLHWLEAG
jgi:hypothetical protein